MASASLAEAPEKPAPLPATALLALEMKERLEKKRAKERETRALLGEDKGAEAAEAAEGDEKNDDDDDDGGGWEQNVSRTTRIRRAKRAERQREAAEKEAAEKAENASEVDSRQVPNVSRETNASDAATATETKCSLATDTARVADLNAAADASAAFFRGDEIAVATDEVESEDDEDEEDAGSSEEEEEDFESTVVSATGDYAMQNVILQMGLRLTTPDGVRVSELRRWVLRCHACGDVTKQTTRVFCAKCGNATLQKVQHTVGEGGAEQFGVRRKHKIRGTRFSLPAPKGGRREKAPILREDQLIGMRGVKKRDDEDVFAAEYNEESFAGSSRGQKPGAAHLYHQRDLVESGGFPKKNPNERRFVRTNRRRK